MRNIDLSPLYRSFIGFDHLASMMDTASKNEKQSTYPPEFGEKEKVGGGACCKRGEEATGEVFEKHAEKCHSIGCLEITLQRGRVKSHGH